MEEKTWKEIWSDRVTKLLSRRFLGFPMALALFYFRPELAGQVIVLYGILVGGPIASAWVKNGRAK